MLLMLLQDPAKNDDNNLKDLVSSINDNLSVFMLIQMNPSVFSRFHSNSLNVTNCFVLSYVQTVTGDR